MLGTIDPQRVCAVVLAGGRGSRMGGIDKGLQHFRGQPLAWHALQRLKNQTPGAPGLIAINANRNAPDYAAWGHPVWPDADEPASSPANVQFAGPLAGFLSALQHSQQAASAFDYVLTVPCDSPLFPLDLLERLSTALVQNRTRIALASAPEPDPHGKPVLRPQPVFCLMRADLGPSLADFMAGGGRKIGTWTAQHAAIAVAFGPDGYDPRSFANANTLDQLHELEQQ